MKPNRRKKPYLERRRGQSRPITTTALSSKKRKSEQRIRILSTIKTAGEILPAVGGQLDKLKDVIGRVQAADDYTEPLAKLNVEAESEGIDSPLIPGIGGDPRTEAGAVVSSPSYDAAPAPTLQESLDVRRSIWVIVDALHNANAEERKGILSSLEGELSKLDPAGADLARKRLEKHGITLGEGTGYDSSKMTTAGWLLRVDPEEFEAVYSEFLDYCTDVGIDLESLPVSEKIGHIVAYLNPNSKGARRKYLSGAFCVKKLLDPQDLQGNCRAYTTLAGMIGERLFGSDSDISFGACLSPGHSFSYAKTPQGTVYFDATHGIKPLNKKKFMAEHKNSSHIYPVEADMESFCYSLLQDSKKRIPPGEWNKRYGSLITAKGSAFCKCIIAKNIYECKGNLDEARTILEGVIAEDPHNFNALMLQGNILYDNGLFDIAIISYKQALAVSPKYSVANYAYATGLSALKEYDEALLYCEHALKYDPKYIDGYKLKSQILNKKGLTEEAKKALDEARRLEDAKKTDKFEYEVTWSVWLDDLAVSAAAGKLTTLVTDAKRLLGILASPALGAHRPADEIDYNGPQSGAEAVSTLASQAKVLVKEQKFEEVFDLFQDIDIRSFSDAEPLMYLGIARMQVGDYKEAKECFGLVLENADAPEDLRYKALGNMGNAYYKEGEYVQARRCWREMPEEKYPEALLFIGRSILDEALRGYPSREEIGLAVASIDRYLSLTEGSAGSEQVKNQRVSAYVMKADAYKSIDDRENELQARLQIQAVFPENNPNNEAVVRLRIPGKLMKQKLLDMGFDSSFALILEDNAYEIADLLTDELVERNPKLAKDLVHSARTVAKNLEYFKSIGVGFDSQSSDLDLLVYDVTADIASAYPAGEGASSDELMGNIRSRIGELKSMISRLGYPEHMVKGHLTAAYSVSAYIDSALIANDTRLAKELVERSETVKQNEAFLISRGFSAGELAGRPGLLAYSDLVSVAGKSKDALSLDALEKDLSASAEGKMRRMGFYDARDLRMHKKDVEILSPWLSDELINSNSELAREIVLNADTFIGNLSFLKKRGASPDLGNIGHALVLMQKGLIKCAKNAIAENAGKDPAEVMEAVCSAYIDSAYTNQMKAFANRMPDAQLAGMKADYDRVFANPYERLRFMDEVALMIRNFPNRGGDNLEMWVKYLHVGRVASSILRISKTPEEAYAAITLVNEHTAKGYETSLPDQHFIGFIAHVAEAATDLSELQKGLALGTRENAVEHLHTEYLEDKDKLLDVLRASRNGNKERTWELRMLLSFDEYKLHDAVYGLYKENPLAKPLVHDLIKKTRDHPDASHISGIIDVAGESTEIKGGFSEYRFLEHGNKEGYVYRTAEGKEFLVKYFVDGSRGQYRVEVHDSELSKENLDTRVALISTVMQPGSEIPSVNYFFYENDDIKNRYSGHFKGGYSGIGTGLLYCLKCVLQDAGYNGMKVWKPSEGALDFYQDTGGQLPRFPVLSEKATHAQKNEVLRHMRYTPYCIGQNTPELEWSMHLNHMASYLGGKDTQAYQDYASNKENREWFMQINNRMRWISQIERFTQDDKAKLEELSKENADVQSDDRIQVDEQAGYLRYVKQYDADTVRKHLAYLKQNNALEYARFIKSVNNALALKEKSEGHKAATKLSILESVQINLGIENDQVVSYVKGLDEIFYSFNATAASKQIPNINIYSRLASSQRLVRLQSLTKEADFSSRLKELARDDPKEFALISRSLDQALDLRQRIDSAKKDGPLKKISELINTENHPLFELYPSDDARRIPVIDIRPAEGAGSADAVNTFDLDAFLVQGKTEKGYSFRIHGKTWVLKYTDSWDEKREKDTSRFIEVEILDPGISVTELDYLIQTDDVQGMGLTDFGGPVHIVRKKGGDTSVAYIKAEIPDGKKRAVIQKLSYIGGNEKDYSLYKGGTGYKGIGSGLVYCLSEVLKAQPEGYGSMVVNRDQTGEQNGVFIESFYTHIGAIELRDPLIPDGISRQDRALILGQRLRPYSIIKATVEEEWQDHLSNVYATIGTINPAAYEEYVRKNKDWFYSINERMRYLKYVESLSSEQLADLTEAKKSVDDLTPALGRYGLFSVYQHSFEYRELCRKYNVRPDGYEAANPVESLNQVLAQLYANGATKEEIRFSFVGAFYELAQKDIVAVANDLLSDDELCLPDQFVYALMEDAARKDMHNWITFDLSNRGPGFGEGMEYGRVRLTGAGSADYVGKRMEGYHVIVSGNVGSYAGAELSGGEITVEGAAGDSAGYRMQEGIISITDTQTSPEHVGAAMRGGLIITKSIEQGFCPGIGENMSGGIAVVEGDVLSSGTGEKMRNGHIYVAGNVRYDICSSMVDGRIEVFGSAETIGQGMIEGKAVVHGRIGNAGKGMNGGLIDARGGIDLIEGQTGGLIISGRDIDRIRGLSADAVVVCLGTVQNVSSCESGTIYARAVAQVSEDSKADVWLIEAPENIPADAVLSAIESKKALVPAEAKGGTIRLSADGRAYAEYLNASCESVSVDLGLALSKEQRLAQEISSLAANQRCIARLPENVLSLLLSAIDVPRGEQTSWGLASMALQMEALGIHVGYWDMEALVKQMLEREIAAVTGSQALLEIHARDYLEAVKKSTGLLKMMQNKIENPLSSGPQASNPRSFENLFSDYGFNVVQLDASDSLAQESRSVLAAGDNKTIIRLDFSRLANKKLQDVYSVIEYWSYELGDVYGKIFPLTDSNNLFKELIKNAYLHGNRKDASLSIYLRVDRDNGKIEVYDQAKAQGDHSSTEEIDYEAYEARIGGVGAFQQILRHHGLDYSGETLTDPETLEVLGSRVVVYDGLDRSAKKTWSTNKRINEILIATSLLSPEEIKKVRSYGINSVSSWFAPYIDGIAEGTFDLEAALSNSVRFDCSNETTTHLDRNEAMWLKRSIPVIVDSKSDGDTIVIANLGTAPDCGELKDAVRRTIKECDRQGKDVSIKLVGFDISLGNLSKAQGTLAEFVESLPAQWRNRVSFDLGYTDLEEDSGAGLWKALSEGRINPDVLMMRNTCVSPGEGKLESETETKTRILSNSVKRPGLLLISRGFAGRDALYALFDQSGKQIIRDNNVELIVPSDSPRSILGSIEGRGIKGVIEDILLKEVVSEEIKAKIQAYGIDSVSSWFAPYAERIAEGTFDLEAALSASFGAGSARYPTEAFDQTEVSQLMQAIPTIVSEKMDGETVHVMNLGNVPDCGELIDVARRTMEECDSQEKKVEIHLTGIDYSAENLNKARKAADAFIGSLPDEWRGKVTFEFHYADLLDTALYTALEEQGYKADVLMSRHTYLYPAKQENKGDQDYYDQIKSMSGYVNSPGLLLITKGFAKHKGYYLHKNGPEERETNLGFVQSLRAKDKWGLQYDESGNGRLNSPVVPAARGMDNPSANLIKERIYRDLNDQGKAGILSAAFVRELVANNVPADLYEGAIDYCIGRLGAEQLSEQTIPSIIGEWITVRWLCESEKEAMGHVEGTLRDPGPSEKAIVDECVKAIEGFTRALRKDGQAAAWFEDRALELSENKNMTQLLYSGVLEGGHVYGIALFRASLEDGSKEAVEVDRILSWAVSAKRDLAVDVKNALTSGNEMERAASNVLSNAIAAGDTKDNERLLDLQEQFAQFYDQVVSSENELKDDASREELEKTLALAIGAINSFQRMREAIDYKNSKTSQDDYNGTDQNILPILSFYYHCRKVERDICARLLLIGADDRQLWNRYMIAGACIPGQSVEELLDLPVLENGVKRAPSDRDIQGRISRTKELCGHMAAAMGIYGYRPPFDLVKLVEKLGEIQESTGASTDSGLPMAPEVISSRKLSKEDAMVWLVARNHAKPEDLITVNEGLVYGKNGAEIRVYDLSELKVEEWVRAQNRIRAKEGKPDIEIGTDEETGAILMKKGEFGEFEKEHPEYLEAVGRLAESGTNSLDGIFEALDAAESMTIHEHDAQKERDSSVDRLTKIREEYERNKGGPSPFLFMEIKDVVHIASLIARGGSGHSERELRGILAWVESLSRPTFDFYQTVIRNAGDQEVREILENNRAALSFDRELETNGRFIEVASRKSISIYFDMYKESNHVLAGSNLTHFYEDLDAGKTERFMGDGRLKVGVVVPCVSDLDMAMFQRTLPPKQRNVDYLYFIPFGGNMEVDGATGRLMIKEALYVDPLSKDGKLSVLRFSKPVPLDKVLYTGFDQKFAEGLEDIGYSRISYSGPYGTSKLGSKQLCEEKGIPTPAYTVIDSETRDIRAAIIEFAGRTRCSGGYVVKPESGSQGRGVAMFPSDSVDDIARHAEEDRRKYGKVLVEERIPSYPYFRDGKRMDWNMRVLVFCSQGNVTLSKDAIEIRGKVYDKRPVNVSAGADVLAYEKTLHEMGFSPSEVEIIHKDIETLAKKAVEGKFENAFFGFDIIMGEDRKLSILEINSGPVGGLGSLRKLNCKDPEKIWAAASVFTRFIDSLPIHNPRDSAAPEKLTLENSGIRVYAKLSQGLLEYEQDYEAAKEALRRCIKADPTQAFPYFEMSWILMRQGIYDQALVYSKKAADLDPMYLNGKGEACNLLGRYDEAAKCFFELLDSGESRLDEWEKTAYNVYAGDALAAAGDNAGALRLYKDHLLRKMEDGSSRIAPGIEKREGHILFRIWINRAAALSLERGPEEWSLYHLIQTCLKEAVKNLDPKERDEVISSLEADDLYKEILPEIKEAIRTDGTEGVFELRDVASSPPSNGDARLDLIEHAAGSKVEGRKAVEAIANGIKQAQSDADLLQRLEGFKEDAKKVLRGDPVIIKRLRDRICALNDSDFLEVKEGMLNALEAVGKLKDSVNLTSGFPAEKELFTLTGLDTQTLNTEISQFYATKGVEMDSPALLKANRMVSWFKAKDVAGVQRRGFSYARGGETFFSTSLLGEGVCGEAKCPGFSALGVLFGRAIGLDVSFYASYNHVYVLLESDGRSDILDLVNGVRISPNKADALGRKYSGLSKADDALMLHAFRIGECIQQERYSESLDLIKGVPDKYLEPSGQNLFLHYTLGNAFQACAKNALSSGQKQKADEYLEKSREFYSNITGLRKNAASVWEREGDVLSMLGRHDEALECFGNAKIRSDSAKVLTERGRRMLQLGRKVEAKRMFERALREERDYGPAVKGLSEIDAKTDSSGLAHLGGLEDLASDAKEGIARFQEKINQTSERQGSDELNSSASDGALENAVEALFKLSGIPPRQLPELRAKIEKRGLEDPAKSGESIANEVVRERVILLEQLSAHWINAAGALMQTVEFLMAKLDSCDSKKGASVIPELEKTLLMLERKYNFPNRSVPALSGEAATLIYGMRDDIGLLRGEMQKLGDARDEEAYREGVSELAIVSDRMFDSVKRYQYLVNEYVPPGMKTSLGESTERILREYPTRESVRDDLAYREKNGIESDMFVTEAAKIYGLETKGEEISMEAPSEKGGPDKAIPSKEGEGLKLLNIERPRSSPKEHSSGIGWLDLFATDAAKGSVKVLDENRAAGLLKIIASGSIDVLSVRRALWAFVDVLHEGDSFEASASLDVIEGVLSEMDDSDAVKVRSQLALFGIEKGRMLRMPDPVRLLRMSLSEYYEILGDYREYCKSKGADLNDSNQSTEERVTHIRDFLKIIPLESLYSYSEGENCVRSILSTGRGNCRAHSLLAALLGEASGLKIGISETTTHSFNYVDLQDGRKYFDIISGAGLADKHSLANSPPHAGAIDISPTMLCYSILQESSDRITPKEWEMRYSDAAVSQDPAYGTFLKAMNLMLEGKHSDPLVQKLLDDVIEINNEFYDSYFYKGYEYHFSGKESEALAWFDIVTEKVPANIAAWYYKARSYSALRKWDAVLECCKRINELSPQGSNTLQLEAEAHYRLGNLDEAFDSYMVLATVHPEDQKVWQSLMVIGERLGRSEEVKEMREALEPFVKTEIPADGYTDGIPRKESMDRLKERKDPDAGKSQADLQSLGGLPAKERIRADKALLLDAIGRASTNPGVKLGSNHASLVSKILRSSDLGENVRIDEAEEDIALDLKSAGIVGIDGGELFIRSESRLISAAQNSLSGVPEEIQNQPVGSAGKRGPGQPKERKVKEESCVPSERPPEDRVTERLKAKARELVKSGFSSSELDAIACAFMGEPEFAEEELAKRLKGRYDLGLVRSLLNDLNQAGLVRIRAMSVSEIKELNARGHSYPPHYRIYKYIAEPGAFEILQEAVEAPAKNEEAAPSMKTLAERDPEGFYEKLFRTDGLEYDLEKTNYLIVVPAAGPTDWRVHVKDEEQALRFAEEIGCPLKVVLSPGKASEYYLEYSWLREAQAEGGFRTVRSDTFTKKDLLSKVIAEGMNPYITEPGGKNAVEFTGAMRSRSEDRSPLALAAKIIRSLALPTDAEGRVSLDNLNSLKERGLVSGETISFLVQNGLALKSTNRESLKWIPLAAASRIELDLKTSMGAESPDSGRSVDFPASAEGLARKISRPAGH